MSGTVLEIKSLTRRFGPLTAVDALRTSMLAESTCTFGLGHDYAVIFLTRTILVFLGAQLYPRLAS